MRLGPAMFRARSLAATAALATLGGVSGCAGVSLDRSQLITDIADRLELAESLTFTAGYEVSGGATVTIAQAQDPTRLALDYAGGKVVLATGRVVVCAKAEQTVCSVNPDSAAARGAALRAAATQAGLPAPESVAGLLGAAAADANAVVDRRDTTLVGRHATCVSVSGLATAEPFDACVTSDGLLASFAGTVEGQELRVTLTSYRDAADADAFDPPAGAVIEQPPSSTLPASSPPPA
jgi:hypothetical protein